MSYNVTLFGLKFTLSPVAFTIPLGSRHWDIYWYGIIIAAGFYSPPARITLYSTARS